MDNFSADQQEKLSLLLSKVQKETSDEEFIYGVTSRASRGIFKRVDDFLIDHSHVPSKEKAYFFELLATMIRAGIPINKALKILTKRTDHPRLRRITATLSYELEHGRPLSQALERFSDVFSETECSVIRSAEAVGNLDLTLKKIADSLDRQNEVIMRLKAALIYPVIVIGALIIGAIVMLVAVVPRIQEIFSQSSLALPLPTRVLLSLSLFLTNSWWILLIIAIFAVVGFHMYVNSEEGRFSWDFRKLRIPVAGKLLRKMFIMRFTDTLGLLLESGLPINKALEFVASAIGNEVYRLKTYEALGEIQEGKKLSTALATAPFLFPESVTNMLAVGEHAASLGDISINIGAHYQREIDYSLKNMTAVLGPALILVIGVMVVFFALAVLSPIFSLTQGIQ